MKRLINTCLALGLSLGATFALAETVVIEIKDSVYGDGNPVTVKVGDTVKWLNVEKRQYHSVWFEEEGFPEADYFFPEESWERTFDKPGTYNYRCGPHEEMFGTIIVVE